MSDDDSYVFPVPPRPSLGHRIRTRFRLERAASVAGIIAAIAGVIALWPILFPAPVPVPVPPTIPSFSTGPIEGEGKSTKDYCDPRRDALQKQYSDYIIEVVYLPEQHEEHRDSLGMKHDNYTYSCGFVAHKK